MKWFMIRFFSFFLVIQGLLFCMHYYNHKNPSPKYIDSYNKCRCWFYPRSFQIQIQYNPNLGYINEHLSQIRCSIESNSFVCSTNIDASRLSRNVMINIEVLFKNTTKNESTIFC